MKGNEFDSSGNIGTDQRLSAKLAICCSHNISGLLSMDIFSPSSKLHGKVAG